MTPHIDAKPARVVPGVVTLVVPCLPEYVSVARLTILGIVGRFPWTADEVEDLRLAVGEVCADAIERASEHDSDTTSGLSIEIVAITSKDALTIDIRDHVPPAPFVAEHNGKHDLDTLVLHDRQSISDALVGELVDSFERSHEMGGTVVRLVKKFPESISA